jgi:hypothetical protein
VENKSSAIFPGVAGSAYQLPTTAKIYGTVLPDNQLYKLFIDRPRQHLGEDAFESERGYKVAMKQALKYMELTLMTKLDANGLEKLRNSCVQNVSVTKKTSSNQTIFRMGYAPRHFYRISQRRVHAMTPQAIWEFNQLVTPFTTQQAAELLLNQTTHVSLFNLLADKNDTVIPNTLPLPTDKNISAIKIRTGFRRWKQLPRVKQIINGFFDAYYEATAKAKTDVEKLTAIAKLCKSIEIFHVFPDGNSRTMAFILLPKLLRENGLAHGVILGYSAFHDGMFSVQEMVVQIVEGIETFYKEFPMLEQPKYIAT